jgi:hypothetical protein
MCAEEAEPLKRRRRKDIFATDEHGIKTLHSEPEA